MKNTFAIQPNSPPRNKSMWRLGLAGGLSWLLVLGATAGGQTADQWVSTGRAALVQQDIVTANAAFQHALTADPHNQNANFFGAFTRIAVLINANGAGTVGGLLTGLGVAASGRNLWNWTADFQRNLYKEPVLPATSPTSGAVIGVLTNTVLPQLTAALANLSQLSTNYTVTLAGEFTHHGNSNAVVVYADVVLAQSALAAIQAAVLTIGSYNLNLSTHDLVTKFEALHHGSGSIDPNTDVLTPYPQLFTLTPNAATALPAAGQSLNSAITAFSNAWQLVRSQQGRLLCSTNKLQSLELGQAALAGPVTITPGGQSVTVALAPFFNAPVNLRADFPTIQNDPTNNHPSVVAGSFADPTMGGVLPAATQQWWINLLESRKLRIPVITQPTVAPPTIAPAGGTFTNSVTVTLTCSTAGATIRYTTTGSSPTASSPVYSKPLAVTSTSTITAKAFKTGIATSASATATFTIITTTPAVATPTITPAGGSFTNQVKVTLSCTTAGATIRYTTNGADPASSSTSYKTALTLTNSVTLKAAAFKTKMADSAVASAAFAIIPPPPLTITTFGLPAGNTKAKYSAALTATGGVTPYKWSWTAASGSKLPPGLTVNATTGAITGKPTKAGTFFVTVKVTDAKKQTSSQPLEVIITTGS